MHTTIKTALAVMLLAALAACGNPPVAASNYTLVQPLSQTEWVERTAALQAARVSNNNLIMMR